MRKRLFVPGLTLALFIAGAAWAMPSAAAPSAVIVSTEATVRARVVGRVTSVEASGHIVTIEAADGSTEFSAITAGDQVQILLAGNPPSAARMPARAMGTGPVRPLNADPSRRFLGVTLLAMSGAVIVLCTRRRRNLLISAPGRSKLVDAPATHQSPVSSYV